MEGAFCILVVCFLRFRYCICAIHEVPIGILLVLKSSQINPYIMSEREDDDAEGYDAAPVESPLQLAKRESRAVWCLRLTTLTVLFLTAVRTSERLLENACYVSHVVFPLPHFLSHYTHNTQQTFICWIILDVETQDQRDSFENAFDMHAAQILSAVNTGSLTRYKALDSFSKDMTSFAQARQRLENLPATSVPPRREELGNTSLSSSSSFLNIPNYARKAFATVEAAGVIGLIWTPVVSSDELLNWNAYSVENSDWITEDQSFLQESGHEMADSPFLSTIAAAQEGVEGLDRSSPDEIPPAVFGWDGSGAATLASASESYMPVWQFYPPPADPSLVNCDMLSYPFYAGSLRTVVEEEATILLSRAYVMGDWFPAKILQMLHPGAPLSDSDGPISNLYTPIYDKFQKENRNVVGVLTSHLIWKTFFENTLPLGSPAPLAVVLINSCGQNYTFEVEGVNSTFVGYVKTSAEAHT